MTGHDLAELRELDEKIYTALMFVHYEPTTSCQLAYLSRLKTGSGNRILIRAL